MHVCCRGHFGSSPSEPPPWFSLILLLVAMFNPSGVSVGEFTGIDEACEKVGIAGVRSDPKTLRGAIMLALGSPQSLNDIAYMPEQGYAEALTKVFLGEDLDRRGLTLTETSRANQLRVAILRTTGAGSEPPDLASQAGAPLQLALTNQAQAAAPAQSSARYGRRV